METNTANGVGGRRDRGHAVVIGHAAGSRMMTRALLMMIAVLIAIGPELQAVSIRTEFTRRARHVMMVEVRDRGGKTGLWTVILFDKHL